MANRDAAPTAATTPGASQPVIKRQFLPRIDMADLRFAPTIAAVCLFVIVVAAR